MVYHISIPSFIHIVSYSTKHFMKVWVWVFGYKRQQKKMKKKNCNITWCHRRLGHQTDEVVVDFLQFFLPLLCWLLTGLYKWIRFNQRFRRILHEVFLNSSYGLFIGFPLIPQLVENMVNYSEWFGARITRRWDSVFDRLSHQTHSLMNA